jgi:hypothetical protein
MSFRGPQAQSDKLPNYQLTQPVPARRGLPNSSSHAFMLVIIRTMDWNHAAMRNFTH